MHSLDTAVFAKVFAEHERDIHGADNPEPIPATCLDDTKLRYDAALEERAHQPGDLHIYRITCEVCGGKGTVLLTVEPQTTPDREEEPT